MKFKNYLKRKLNNSLYNNLIEGFFKEITDDIKIIEEDILRNTPNPFVNQIYEEYELDPIAKKFIKKRYKQDYCPSSLFKYFNKSERFNYLVLRNRLDKVLGIKNMVYEKI